MSSLAIKDSDDAELNDFEAADKLRLNAINCLEQAENFYLEVLKSFPDVCDYELAHERGKVDAMAWQTRQLKSYGSVYFSQAGQDSFIDDQIYKGKRNGTFLEIGGYDGLSNSNCLFFEAMRGWDGLLIEPSPQQIEKAKTIRQCQCVQTAVGVESGTEKFLNIVSGYTQLGGLIETFTEETIKQARSHEQHVEEIIEVSVKTLSDILYEKNITNIDYCSFDMRGQEFEILRKFPFDDINITTWSIENSQQNAELGRLMVQNGYTFMTVLGHDEIYHKF